MYSQYTIYRRKSLKTLTQNKILLNNSQAFRNVAMTSKCEQKQNNYQAIKKRNWQGK